VGKIPQKRPCYNPQFVYFLRITPRKAAFLHLHGVWSQSCHEAECPFAEKPKLVANMDKNTVFEHHYLLSLGQSQGGQESRKGARHPKTDSSQLKACAQV